jgi:DNA-binding CsgD family transcriptional regulator
MRRRSNEGALNSLQGVDPGGLEKLSPREEQVLALASTGLLDKQIAVQMNVSLNTLRTYWTRIRAKVGEVPRSALAVSYVERRSNVGAVEGASWHIDLVEGIMHYYGERDILPQGSISVEEMLERFHPEDGPRVRSLLQAVEEQDVPAFSFVSRMITDKGVELASAYVEVIRDETGRAIRLVGRHVPIMNLTSSLSGNFFIGSYERDLSNFDLIVDDGFCAIYRVDRNDPDLYETVISRLCPDYREGARNATQLMIDEGRTNLRRTYQLCFENGERLWASSALHLEYVDEKPVRLLMTVVAYQ